MSIEDKVLKLETIQDKIEKDLKAFICGDLEKLIPDNHLSLLEEVCDMHQKDFKDVISDRLKKLTIRMDKVSETFKESVGEILRSISTEMPSLNDSRKVK